MHPQLQQIIDDLDSAQRRLHAFAISVPDERWTVRPAPERWSVSECVAHLNLTSQAYLPILDEALERARTLGRTNVKRYRRDFMGWMLWRMMPPPVRFRTRTAAPFVPASDLAPERLRSDFAQLQDEQRRRTADADGLKLGSVKVASPFDPRVHYNLYSCLSIIPPHQHRHLWQAERVAADEKAHALRGLGRKPTSGSN